MIDDERVVALSDSEVIKRTALANTKKPIDGYSSDNGELRTKVRLLIMALDVDFN